MTITGEASTKESVGAAVFAMHIMIWTAGNSPQCSCSLRSSSNICSRCVSVEEKKKTNCRTASCRTNNRNFRVAPRASIIFFKLKKREKVQKTKNLLHGSIRCCGYYCYCCCRFEFAPGFCQARKEASRAWSRVAFLAACSTLIRAAF